MKRMTTVGRWVGFCGIIAAGVLFPWLTNAQPAGKEPKTPPAKLSAAEAAKTFNVADDLRFDQVLAEPVVKQPLALSFDERGRLWVVQYIQYPHPAGLKVVSRDIFCRVVYAKVPPPPPNPFPRNHVIPLPDTPKGNPV